MGLVFFSGVICAVPFQANPFDEGQGRVCLDVLKLGPKEITC